LHPIAIQKLQKTFKRHELQFGYLKIHLASNISQPILGMGSGYDFTADISKWLHIGIVKVEYLLPTNSITFDKCSITVTGVPVVTIWRSPRRILPSKAGKILTLHKFSINFLQLINSKILAEPVIYSSSIVRKSHNSALYHNRYIT